MRAILTYHSIDSSGSPISVSADAFRAHVRFLSSGTVPVVPLADLQSAATDKAVALTFDDAFVNFADVALPLLRDHALPATLFVVSDCVGTTNAWGGKPSPGIPTLPLMSWDQVGAATSSGVEIGAHTRRHPDLTTVDASRLVDETEGCADAIVARTGQRPASFAYPYGALNDAAVDAARRVYRRSCTTDFRAVGAAEDPALLPRLDAYYFREPGVLEQWGNPAFRRRLWLRAQGRRVRRFLTTGRVA